MVDKDLSKESDLCVKCGLCCQGLFHGRIHLQDNEVQAGLKKKMEYIPYPEPNKVSLPCSQWAGACQMYDERPEGCRVFRCKLLKGIEKGEITASEAEAVVNEALDLIAECLNVHSHSNNRSRHPSMVLAFYKEIQRLIKRDIELSDEHKEFLFSHAKLSAVLLKIFDKNAENTINKSQVDLSVNP